MDIVSKVPVIRSEGGLVVKVIEDGDKDFKGFGEIYYSRISLFSDRGWKIHSRATCNIMVTSGKVRFVVGDKELSEYVFIDLDENCHKRMTIPPMHWYRFICLEGPHSTILNMLDVRYKEEKACQGQRSLELQEPGAGVIWDEKTIELLSP